MAQNLVNCSVWGTDAELTEGVAEHLANANERLQNDDDEDDLIDSDPPGQLVRIFRTYYEGVGVAYRGFRDEHGVWGVANVMHRRAAPRLFRLWRDEGTEWC